IVLSGDDALTLPLMAVGGHGIISGASNEIPADMVALVGAAERNDFAAARAGHARILPLMAINFVESHPQPGKYAMARTGLLGDALGLPMVAPRVESKEKITGVLKALGLLKPALVGSDARLAPTRLWRFGEPRRGRRVIEAGDGGRFRAAFCSACAVGVTC